MTFDLEAIKKALPMVEVARHLGVVFFRSGTAEWALCPFHEGGKATLCVSAATPARATCWSASCGWNGDIFDFWQQRCNMRKSEAIAALAGLAGLAPLPDGVKWLVEKPVRRAVPLEARIKPDMPPLRALKDSELQTISAGRVGKFGLRLPMPLEGLRRAAVEKMIGFTYWPRDRETGAECKWSRAAWVITDRERWTASFRTLKGEPWSEGVKALTLSGGFARWLIGVANLRGRRQVLLCEGAPDAVAAWALIESAGAANSVAVCCMLSGEYSIPPECLALLKGCRVRIFADNDEPREKKLASGSIMVRAGLEAAARWEHQMQDAGISADVLDLSSVAEAGEKDVADLVGSVGVDGIDVEGLLDF